LNLLDATEMASECFDDNQASEFISRSNDNKYEPLLFGKHTFESEEDSDQGSVMNLLLNELLNISNARAERKKTAQSMVSRTL
jgi:hypothetical protein